MRSRLALLLLGSMLSLPVLCAQDEAPALTSSDPAVRGAERPAKSLVVPAGTRIMLSLKHAITTKTAQAGDGIYAETTFPVVQNHRIVLPAGSYVQGVIRSIKRPGRVKGRAELLMGFNTLILPNGYTVSLSGGPGSVPGAEQHRVKDNEEGTIQAEGSKGKDVETVASTTATGAVVGGLAGRGKGAAIGAGAGGVAGLAIALLTRGNDVRVESGTAVEMVLQRDLVLDEARLPSR